MATVRRKQGAAVAAAPSPSAAPSPAPVPAGSAKVHPPDVQKRIAETAYYLWERRGRPHGQDVAFWVEAEKIVLGHGGPLRA